MERTNSITAGLLSLLLFAATAASAEDLKIQGKSLFTFSGRHFVIQAEKALYQVEKKGLPAATLSKLEKSTMNSEKVTVSIPQSKIEYVWPNTEFAPVSAAAVVTEEPKAEEGRTVLRGNLQVSFSDEHYLVLDQNSVYQVAKSALSEKEIAEFTKVGPGASIAIGVPEAAVRGSWSFKQGPSRTIATIEEPDSIEVRNSMLTIRGTVLYSADSRFVIVRSGPTIYRLRRNGIGTKQPELLEVNGSRVNLTVAVANIAAYW